MLVPLPGDLQRALEESEKRWRAEHQRAEQERQRAEELALEVERLKAELRRQASPPNS
jgi:hypothetical protein